MIEQDLYIFLIDLAKYASIVFVVVLLGMVVLDKKG